MTSLLVVSSCQEMKAVRKNGTLSLSKQVQSRSEPDILTQLQEKKN